MQKAISFLGTGKYETVTYVYQGQAVKARYFPNALSDFFSELDEILVFVTPTVEQHENMDALRTQMGDRLQAIRIPDGQSEDELWQIFGALTEVVDDGDSVIFDITHSLRSIPLLVFLAAAYLRAVRDVEVRRVIYGAFDARDTATGETPVFDLTPFLTLLDWIAATDRFIEIGDGRPLASLLRECRPPGPAMGEDLEARAQGKQLRYAAEAIEGVSQALSIVRPLETMKKAARLEDNLRQARDAVAARAQPFELLSSRVCDAYAPFACSAPLEREHWRANLELQLKMVRWYLDKEKIGEAATLAREWLVSAVAYRMGVKSLVSRDQVRQPIAGALNNMVRLTRDEVIDRPTDFDDVVGSIPIVEDLAMTWNKLRDIRNDLAHVGMNRNARSTASLRRAMVGLYPDLLALASALLGADAEND